MTGVLIRLRKRTTRRLRTDCCSVISLLSSNSLKIAAFWSSANPQTCSTTSGVRILTQIMIKIKENVELEILMSPIHCFSSGHIDSHLRYPHSWVWLTASQIFGLLFAAHKPEDLVTLWNSQETTQKHTQPVASVFLFNNLDKKARTSRVVKTRLRLTHHISLHFISLS